MKKIIQEKENDQNIFEIELRELKNQHIQEINILKNGQNQNIDSNATVNSNQDNQNENMQEEILILK